MGEVMAGSYPVDPSNAQDQQWRSHLLNLAV
jgi:hypothetical protein